MFVSGGPKRRLRWPNPVTETELCARPALASWVFAQEVQFPLACVNATERFAAARELQRWWRGMACRRRLRSVEGAGNHIAERAALLIQSRWRGSASRVVTAGAWRMAEVAAASRLAAAYRGWIGRRIAKRARVEQAKCACSTLQRMFRGRHGKRLWDAAKAERRRQSAIILQRLWRGLLGRRGPKNWRTELKRIDRAVSKLTSTVLTRLCATPSSRHETRAAMHAAHGALLVLRDCETSLALLDACRLDSVVRGRPLSPAVAYASAIVLQLAWSRFGKYELWQPDLLHEALRSARTARALDPAADSYAYWHFTYFSEPSLPSKRKCAWSLCAHAVAIHTSRADTKFWQLGSAAVIQAPKHVIATCSRLYARARAADVWNAFPEIRECASVFEALFASKSSRLSKARVVYGGSRSFSLEVWLAAGILVCVLREKGHLNAMDLFLVHRCEVAELGLLLHSGALGVPSTAKESSVAEYVLSRLVLVSDSRRSRPGVARPWKLTLPGLQRIRDGREAAQVRHACATCITRAYRVFDQRALFKRTVFQLRQKDAQAAKLAARRACANLQRLELLRTVARAQAAARAAIIRRKILPIAKAAVGVLQCNFRAAAVRRRLAAEAKRKFDGPELVAICTRGVELPSGDKLVVHVTRCGRNFKFVGTDLETCSTYVGFCYERDVDAFLLEHNRRSAIAIRRTQYTEIADLLFGHLALTPQLAGIPTADLCRPGAKGVLVFVPEPCKANGPTAQQRRGLGRQLADTQGVLRRHDARLRTHIDARRARGLAPDDPQPTPQDRAIAQARFKMRLYRDLSFLKAKAACR